MISLTALHLLDIKTHLPTNPNKIDTRQLTTIFWTHNANHDQQYIVRNTHSNEYYKLKSIITNVLLYRKCIRR